MPALDMPPVTDVHRQHAYILLRPKGISYTAAMTLPEHALLARVIEARAHQIRTEAWLETQQRTVVPVRRCRPGVDGHPVKWATQLVMGDYAPVHQPDLLNP